MNEIVKFASEEFGSLRTLQIEGETWFSGKDVAQCLEYSNPQKAIRDHVDEEDRTVNEAFTVNGTKAVLINESGLYALVISSKMEQAKAFKRWITKDVLPSIRKNGGYISGQEELSDEELLAKALKVAENKIKERDAIIEKQTAKIEEDAPKVVFAETVIASDQEVSVDTLAKMITSNGFKIGQRKLFKWLRENGYLLKSKKEWNKPKQKYVEAGLFTVRLKTFQANGQTKTIVTPMITSKGQVYFINKICGVKNRSG